MGRAPAGLLLLVILIVSACGASSPIDDALGHMRSARQVHVVGTYDAKSSAGVSVDGTLSRSGFSGQGGDGELPIRLTTLGGLADDLASWSSRHPAFPLDTVPDDKFSKWGTVRVGLDSGGRIVDLWLWDGRYGLTLKLTEYR